MEDNMAQIPHERFWSLTIGQDDSHCIDIMLNGDVLEIGIHNDSTSAKQQFSDVEIRAIIRGLQQIEERIIQHRQYIAQTAPSDLIPGQNPPSRPGTRYDPT